MPINATRFWLLSAAALAVTSLAQAQAPGLPGKTSPGVTVVNGAEKSVDPQRQAVERVDEVVRSFEEPEITDPTVFVKSAALGELTGIELAKLARGKSQDARIQSFAGRMLEDHDAVRAGLAAIAKRKRLDVPTSLDYEDEQLVKEGAEKSGPEFDAWYALQMFAEQQKSMALFHGAAKMPDADLAAFAKKTLPTLEERQNLAAALTGASKP